LTAVTLFGEFMTFVFFVMGVVLTYVFSAFAAIKDLTGDWKKDPRYEDSWYFVCAKPEGK
jgi:hypothetical protein